MIVTAVVVSYWPERVKFLPRIVDALRFQTHPVDNILVFSNNKDHQLVIPGADVINSGRNFTSRAKYAVAMLVPSDYYILLDDDVCPEPGVVENFLAYAADDHNYGVCYSDYGMQFTTKKFHQATEIKGHEIQEPVLVDAFIGRTQFLSFDVITAMFYAEHSIRLDEEGYLYDGEDILIALANHPARIIPNSPGRTQFRCQSPIIEGSQHQTMQDDWGYHILRDAFGWKAIQRIRPVQAEKLPGPIPGIDEHDLRAMAEYRESSGKRT